MQQLYREKLLDFDHRLLPDTVYNWYRNWWIYQNLLHNIYHHSLFGHNKSFFQRYLGFDNFQCMFQYDLLERNYNWILHKKSKLLGNFVEKSSKRRNIIQHYDSLCLRYLLLRWTLCWWSLCNDWFRTGPRIQICDFLNDLENSGTL